MAEAQKPTFISHPDWTPEGFFLRLGRTTSGAVTQGTMFIEDTTQPKLGPFSTWEEADKARLEWFRSNR